MDFVKKLVSSVNNFLERADREEKEHAMELLKPPVSEETKDDVLKRGAAGNVLDFDQMEKQGKPEDLSAQAPMPPPSAPPGATPLPLPPQMGGAPLPPMQPLMNSSAEIPVVARGEEKLVGMKTRESGENPEASGSIVANKRNDTMYNARNEVVALIHKRYAKYGESVASAILTKAFLPNGLELLLAKLELQTSGSTMRDHDQVVQFIDRVGLQEFCQRVGIRYDEKKVRTERAAFTEVERKKRSTGSFSQRAQANPSGGAPKIQLQKMNIRPVSLGSGDPESSGSAAGGSRPKTAPSTVPSNLRGASPTLTPPVGATPVPLPAGATPRPLPPSATAGAPPSVGGAPRPLPPRTPEPPPELDTLPPPVGVHTPPPLETEDDGGGSGGAMDFLAQECKTDRFFIDDLGKS